ncbi:MAG: hypothetical protein HQK50_09305 [Oligoflexia bacterium]|nr:hypothetical protein [Oligoflexia bacterium]
MNINDLERLIEFCKKNGVQRLQIPEVTLEFKDEVIIKNKEDTVDIYDNSYDYEEQQFQ